LEHPWIACMVSFSPDGKTLASAGTDMAVRVWDVATGKLLRTLEGHQKVLTSLSFSHDAKLLASGSYDGTIRLWDVAAGKELRRLKKCQELAFGLSFAPDGKVLASASIGPTVRLWDVTTGEELHRPEGAHTGGVRSLSFSLDGRMLATAGVWGEGKDTVRLWNTASGKPLERLEHPERADSKAFAIESVEHPERANAVAFSSDGKTLASGGKGTICIWDVTTGQPRRKLEAPGGSPLAFSPDGKLLAAGSDEGYVLETKGTVRLWDVGSGTQFHKLEHPNQTMSVTFSPDGKMLAVGTERAILYLWDAVTGKELLKLDKSVKHWNEIAALSFSPDGKTLAVGSSDWKIHLLEVSTGKELSTLAGHKDSVQALAFSPSGRLLASGSADQTVRLWEVNAGLAKECHLFRGHAAEVTAVAFSPDGRRLASGSRDSTALVWDVTGRAAGQTDATSPTGRQNRVASLTQGELTASWRSLASEDAREAYQALRTLAAVPDQAVPFLAGRLLLKKFDPQQVVHLLADLDSEEFRVRSQATQELKKLGEAAEPALRQALKAHPSVEVRRRIQQLLAEIAPEGASLRRLRAVEVLAWIDNPAARELLEKVAATPPREEVGQEAKAALKSLRRARPNP
jgi:WD40 repeat protein